MTERGASEPPTERQRTNRLEFVRWETRLAAFTACSEDEDVEEEKLRHKKISEKFSAHLSLSLFATTISTRVVPRPRRLPLILTEPPLGSILLVPSLTD